MIDDESAGADIDSHPLQGMGDQAGMWVEGEWEVVLEQIPTVAAEGKTTETTATATAMTATITTTTVITTTMLPAPDVDEGSHSHQSDEASEAGKRDVAIGVGEESHPHQLDEAGAVGERYVELGMMATSTAGERDVVIGVDGDFHPHQLDEADAEGKKDVELGMMNRFSEMVTMQGNILHEKVINGDLEDLDDDTRMVLQDKDTLLNIIQGSHDYRTAKIDAMGGGDIWRGNGRWKEEITAGENKGPGEREEKERGQEKTRRGREKEGERRERTAARGWLKEI
ncbi:hypothetical protein CBR_g32250 [Chara braunii]|uniref:Uncharacterized protein n=1 Tax=Chara braunii TaxID=69332 RepID=A0A388JNA9_CHABU|nr:hypothetical protein CBR_g32250 [Chara braunii]|eukprot:GBG59233.1 hypothetical protein CBR_g32250 [Chara braunii]